MRCSKNGITESFQNTKMAEAALRQGRPPELLFCSHREKTALVSKNNLPPNLRTTQTGLPRSVKATNYEQKQEALLPRFRPPRAVENGPATRRQAVGLGFCFGSLLFHAFVRLPAAAVLVGGDLCALPAAAAGASSSLQGVWSRDGINKNEALVQSLQQYGVIKSGKVAEIMESIDRGLFVPTGAPAYMDSPMPIGYNATISAPHMHATCLELLEDHLQPGMHALDIGSGTGYLTACFALMVGPEGRAVGVEHIPELVAGSIENIKKSAAAPLLERGSLFVHVGDGRLGWPESAPYDAIHVGAAAPEVPEALIHQLKPGGRMVIPVGTFFQDLEVVEKKADGSISTHTVTSVRYVPLTSRKAQLQDSQ